MNNDISIHQNFYSCYQSVSNLKQYIIVFKNIHYSPLPVLVGDDGPLFITIAFVFALGDFGTMGDAPFFFFIVYDPL